MKTYRINTYLAVLLVTVAGALAAWVIVRVAYRSQYSVVNASTEAAYTPLQNALLKDGTGGTQNGQSR